SQYWLVPSVPSMTCAPVDHLAIGFEISSEKIAPANPTTAENTSRPVTLIPSALSQVLRPSTLMITDSSSTTARLVARNRTMRFIGGGFPLFWCAVVYPRYLSGLSDVRWGLSARVQS